VFPVFLTHFKTYESVFFRQYYTYITDKRCKRLGSQAWVFICIVISELILNLKFGKELFSQTQMSMMVMWVIVILVISSLGIFASMAYYRHRYPSDVVEATENTSYEIVATSEKGG
jgi:uncharacterized membrane protein